MSDEKVFDIPAAERARDEGMRHAIDHADSRELNWSNRAYDLFVQYACLHGEFMTEDVREWAEQQGLPQPPDRRAWGAIAAIARRRGVVVHVRYAPQKSVNAHRAPKSVWRLREGYGAYKFDA